jgi:Stress responsive A/B Barrel Domain
MMTAPPMGGAMKHKALAALALALAAAASAAQDPAQAQAHDVYFSLNDASPAARAALVAACRKYLAGHDGQLFFSVGVRAAERVRPVNDLDFDVALHITFASRAAHDAYQEHPRHKQFIAEQQQNWKRVRVFDSMVEVGK